MTTTLPPEAGPSRHTPPAAPAAPTSQSNELLANLSLAFGVAGLLPILPLVGSLVAVGCGLTALTRPSPSTEERRRATVGVALGVVGLLAPIVALFVYCVVLGYPFPLHRYHPGG